MESRSELPDAIRLSAIAEGLGLTLEYADATYSISDADLLFKTPNINVMAGFIYGFATHVLSPCENIERTDSQKLAYVDTIMAEILDLDN